MSNSNRNIVFRHPEIAECDLLWQIALNSKRHWGYDDEFMRACAEELKVSFEKLTSPEYFYKLGEVNSSVFGFYCLQQLNTDDFEVEALFVSPDFIGKGLGARLWQALMADAKSLQCKKLIIASEPFAEGFYQQMGAVKVGEVASGSIAGRFIPLMELSI